MTTPIILIEKNEHDVALITDALAGLSVSLQVFAKADEALEFLSRLQPGKQPGLVLLSQEACSPDELGFLRKIRGGNRTRFLPVVMLCPEIPLDYVLECYSAGANSVISKPIDREEFRDLVELLGIYWTTAVRTPSPTDE